MFYERLNRFPPVLVRLLARHETLHRPLTTFEIAQRSGGELDGAHVFTYSMLTAWDNLTVRHMHAFTKACGCDFGNTQQMRRAEDYMRKDPTFRYLRSDENWLTLYKPMMIALRGSYGEVTKDSDIWPPLRALLIRLNPLYQHHAKTRSTSGSQRYRY